ncbi:hypothetical protein BGX26_010508 [Mortierella sp. AD094]|nr:hypothetical protein BGX26_010508 [Mortierella sp. AD094]
MESNPSSLGPFGLRMGQAHHIAYLVAAIIMGSICLISIVVTFILAKTENDLKQRGRYLVFWNGPSNGISREKQISALQREETKGKGFPRADQVMARAQLKMD